jgi:hypothetical protein
MLLWPDPRTLLVRLKENIAVVAIDKHGNESKVYKVEG